MIDYFLAENESAPVTLEIKDSKGGLVRRYSSTDAPVLPDPNKLRIPGYWVRAPQPLSSGRGMHRFLWDMHYTPLPGIDPDYPMAAIYRQTPPRATSPWAMPGDYTVALTVSGKSYAQPLKLQLDPRVKASTTDLQEQFDFSRRLHDLRTMLEPIGKSFDAIIKQLFKLKEQAPSDEVTKSVDAFEKKLKDLGPPNPRPEAPPALHVLESVKSLFGEIEGVDAAPTPKIKAAVADLEVTARSLSDRWKEILSQDLSGLNAQLKAAGLAQIKP
jgi:hypothetical protein